MIQTVLGGVEASELGAVSMHDHLVSDCSGLHRPGVERLDPDAKVSPELAGALRWSQLAVKDNLRLDDPAVLIEELGDASRKGIRTMVECSSLGMGPRHAEFPAISRATGVHVVAAYGSYIPRVVPAWFLELSLEARRAHFVEALTVAIPGTGFRAGILGIMGTTEAFGSLEGADETNDLVVAAAAAAETGAAMQVRLDADAKLGLDVLARAAAEGLEADRVVFTNADEFLDPVYLRDLGQAGAVLELCWGSEFSHIGRFRAAFDYERIDLLLDLLRDAPEVKWVFGHSTWTKAQLRRNGGPGYGHFISRVLPGLSALGVPAATLTRIVVDEPARLLDRAA